MGDLTLTIESKTDDSEKHRLHIDDEVYGYVWRAVGSPSFDWSHLRPENEGGTYATGSADAPEDALKALLTSVHTVDTRLARPTDGE